MKSEKKTNRGPKGRINRPSKKDQPAVVEAPDEDEEIQSLRARIEEIAPQPGTQAQR